MPSAKSLTDVIRHPKIEDGSAMWRVARDSQRLDLNTPYAYILWARDFAATSLVAEVDGRVGGFVSGYMRPADPTTVMVWQIAVDEACRGRGLAGRLLDELAVRTGAEALETTITADNPESIALFGSFAKRQGAQHTVTDLFSVEHFPSGGEYKPELLHRITSLGNTHS
jgi:L-2,4-diaminobutyric acid acetyltransferase